MSHVYIMEGARTAFGGFGRAFLQVGATELGVVTAREALSRAGVAANEVDQVIYGNVIQSSSNAAYMARHIGLQVGIPQQSPALLVNRLCGSGLEAVIQAANLVKLGEAQVVLAGGVENMSQAPHADFTSRFAGSKLGHLQLEDMLLHSLTDQYIGCGMGVTAENLAEKYSISRAEQDEYALQSHQRAADGSGKLAEEIVGVEVKTRGGNVVIDQDEQVRRDTSLEQLAKLRAVFQQGGSVTAGNASTMNDGAASLIVVNEAQIKDRPPLARIVASASVGVAPEIMGIGPAPAARLALQRAGLTLEQMDRIEINEAFAAQYIAVERELGLVRERVNVHGGAIALGHPLGASGARVLLTLAYELRRQGLRYGLAALCIGGGQGIAMVIENTEA